MSGMTQQQQRVLEALLENWGAWGRSGAGLAGRRRCGSAEGRYLTPRADEDAQEDKREHDSIDVDNAEEIEEHLKTMAASKNPLLSSYRRLLHAWYVLLAKPEWFRGKMGIQEFMLKCKRIEAVAGLQAVIDRAERNEHLHSANRSGMYGTAPCVPGRDHPPALAAGGARAKR